MIKGRLILAFIFAAVVSLEQWMLHAVSDNALKVVLFVPCYIFAAASLLVLSGTFFGTVLPSGEIAFREGSLMSKLLTSWDKRGSLCGSFWMTVFYLFVGMLATGIATGLLALLVHSPMLFVKVVGIATVAVAAVMVVMAGPLFFLESDFGKRHRFFAKTVAACWYGIMVAALIALPYFVARPGKVAASYADAGQMILYIALGAGVVFLLARAGMWIYQKTFLGRLIQAFKDGTCLIFVVTQKQQ